MPELMTIRRRLATKNLTPGLTLTLCLALGSSAALPVEPAVRLVVSEKSKIVTLSRASVAALFLKKATTFADGTPVEPIDQTESSPVRATFSDVVLRKPVSKVKIYWLQRVFQGMAVPPPEKASDTEVMETVARNPQAIGYVAGTIKLVGVREVTITE